MRRKHLELKVGKNSFWNGHDASSKVIPPEGT